MRFRIVATLVILAVLALIAFVAKPLVFPDSDAPSQQAPPQQSGDSFHL